jgi:CBS domain-containing protein
MSAPVIALHPHDTAKHAAELLIAHRISGLPVIDADGVPVGLVSEADFVFGDDDARRERHETWLRMISDGQTVNADYLAMLDDELGEVRQFMAAPVVTVAEDAPLAEIVEAMAERHIKRVIVTRDGKLAGVITRHDLLRAKSPQALDPLPSVGKAAEPVKPAAKPKAPPPAAKAAEPPPADGLTAKALQALVAQFEDARETLHRNAADEVRRQRDALVKEMLEAPLPEAEWRAMLAEARSRAAQGERQMPMLRFPAALCDDGGRAVNVPDPDWPRTLRGKAARVYLRWRDELQPQGFRLTAQIVSFPQGLPGDVEMALVWGGR